MDTGHRQRRRDVDLDDPRVWVGAPERVPPEHPGRLEVARVGELALHLRRAVGPGDAIPDPAGDRGRRRRAHDAAACRTASKILAYPVQRQRLPESASRISSSEGAGFASSRSTVATTRPGRAEPALHRSRLDERLLHAVQPFVRRQPLHRRHLVAVGLRPEHEAGADERHRRAGRSTSRTHPARTRSSSPAGRGARAGRRAGSPHPTPPSRGARR